MSNPYRARPSKSRVEAGAPVGYGTHNQNTWNMSQPKPPVTPVNEAFPGPTPNPTNQPKQMNDSWDWGSDNCNNGNDSWNWSVDQSESQQAQQPQQLQQPQQQSQFIQSYGNQNQPVQSYGQEGYFKNVNGNNRYPSQEPASHYPETYPQQANFGYEQQHNSRPPSNKSNTESLGDRHHQEATGFVQHDTVSFGQKHQIPQAPPNNYNWNVVADQQNAMPSGNWKNHSEMPAAGFWQDPNAPKQGWMPKPQVPQQVPPVNENSTLDYNQQWSTEQPDSIPSKTPQEHWQSQNREVGANQQTPYQNYPPSSIPWQPEIPQNAQHWPQPLDAQTQQWLPQNQQEQSTVPETDNSWQIGRGSTLPPSTPMNQVPSVESPEKRKRSGLTPATSSASLNDSSATSNSKMLKDRQDSVLSESSRTSSNFHCQDQDNADVDWNADTEWDTVVPSDLSANFGQMSLSNEQGKLDSQASRNQRVMARSRVDGDAVPENVPVQPPDHGDGMENVLLADDAQSYDAYQNNAGKSMESGNFDQWYKQGVAPGQESSWYAKDRARNVENYENIQQQPAEFVNLEVVAPEAQERDVFGSRESINKETLDNDPKVAGIASKETAESSRDYRHESSNVEVLTMQVQQTVQPEQVMENYEFASNDRNTFLETGELTDSHQEHEPFPPSQDDENDEVPSDIPFVREVPGQSSIDPRRNDPTGQEVYVQSAVRIVDPRRNDPSGQEHNAQTRNVSDRIERRDVPSGQERSLPSLQRSESDTFERRNDPSGRERSLPPQQSRNDPSGEERIVSQVQGILESSETREIPGRGNEIEDPIRQTDSAFRQIPGGASPNESIAIPTDLSGTRVVTGSQELLGSTSSLQDQSNDARNKREEAVGESNDVPKTLSHRDSYDDGDDEGSRHSRDESRERHRDGSQERRRYDYDRKPAFHDREREYDDDYFYDRRRGDYDRFNSREELDRRDVYRDDDRRHPSRDDLDRRDEPDRRTRTKDEVDDRDGRRRIEDRRRDRPDDPRGKDARAFDMRYRDYGDREKRRDDRRTRRYDDYESRETYRREYYDDTYGRSSRPSSRSSYDRDRDYYSRRDPYYNYNGYGGYDYGSNYNNNYYAYLENLRRTNPAAYAEWYHKYYASQQQQVPTRGGTNYSEDRASVHSGRSSCDDRLHEHPSIFLHPPNKALYMPCFGRLGWTKSPLKKRNTTHCDVHRSASDKRNMTEMSVLEDQTTASRLTPTKFFTSHVKGSFSIGLIVHVHASYPSDGERARIDILRMDNVLQHDSVTRELKTYPGPLIKGVTHKKTIIEYCENKIKKATANEDLVDQSSYILLYEFMIMLIQQNGNVVGVDIATLLLKNKEAYPYEALKDRPLSGRRESMISQRSAASGDEGNNREATGASFEKTERTKQRKTVDQMTDEFRNTLLYGLVQEALEYAMDEGLWGHALFLASKLDKRTHASVMTRFANSLPSQDPLQTLYQLHSGRVPASVTCVADSKWDDWRPHLAMIISNTSANPEVNRRSIMILGDTLAVRGDIHAAHFCYILAQVDFSSHEQKDAKLVLIGANHSKPYAEFATQEAIMLTEIYEYARNLSEPGFTLVDLQTFKFNMAAKMVDYGLLEKALLYIEQVAVNIAREPSKYQGSFINGVYELGDRIKYHDPICKDSIEDAANLPWLNNLAEVVGKCQKGEIVQDNAYLQVADVQAYSSQNVPEAENQHQNWNVPEYGEGPTSLMEVPALETQNNWQPMSLPTTIHESSAVDQSYGASNVEESQYQAPQQQQPEYWAQQNYAPDWQQQSQAQYGNQMESENLQQQGNWGYESEKEEKPATPEPPTISMIPSSGKQYDPLEELDSLDTAKSATSQEQKKPVEKTAEKKGANSSGSWFGGLFSKLALKPKNQMILPDDRDPTIVWDPVAKRWMNKDEDSDVSTAPLAPPPKLSDVGFGQSVADRSTQQTFGQSDDASSMPMNQSKFIAGSNVYKLQKSRGMRGNYIDVMNPDTTKPSRPTPATSPMMPIAASSPQLFIPAPVNDPSAPVDFLTPTPAVIPQAGDSTSQGLSRWSSTSSLSREVQSYTMRDPRHTQRNKGPMTTANSASADRSQKNIQKGKYSPR